MFTTPLDVRSAPIEAHRPSRVTPLAHWVTFTLALLFAASENVRAQGTPPADCQSEGGGTVRGVVVDDSTNVPVAGSYIYLFVQGVCRTTTDRLGRFVVLGAPPGALRIETGSPGYRQFRPVEVEVIPGDTSHVELRLIPGGPLQDCRALERCSPLVDGGSGPVQDEADGFRLAALGTAIGLAWGTVGAGEPWYACLPDASAALLEALGERYSPVVDAEECELPRDASGSLARQMRHVGTDHPAFQPRIDRLSEWGPDRRTVALSYYVGPRWAAFWDCDFVRTDRGWLATICVATGVS